MFGKTAAASAGAILLGHLRQQLLDATALSLLLLRHPRLHPPRLQLQLQLQLHLQLQLQPQHRLQRLQRHQRPLQLQRLQQPQLAK